MTDEKLSLVTEILVNWCGLLPDDDDFDENYDECEKIASLILKSISD